MADADSLNEPSSDVDQDLSAIDADVEDDEVSSQSQDVGSRKKSKKKKRKPRDFERSSGDSDSQQAGQDEISPGSNKGVPEEDEGDEADDEASASAKERRDHHGYHHHAQHMRKHSREDRGATGNSVAAVEGVNQTTEESADTDVQPLPLGKLQQIQKAMELISLTQGTPKSMEEAKRKQYQFWDTQPVPKLNEHITSNEPIEADKPQDDIRQETFSLPKGFHWDTMDINNPLELKELYTLLNENYVEDDDNMFRFDYSPEFLQWALQPPGWRKDWHCGVRVTKTKKLIGFISAVPAHIKIYNHRQHMVEINFLCVHKKMRAKRVAPVLIKEITRRVHLTGCFQAVYTAGVVLPKPVASCRYWHRSLNPRKLIEVKFSHLSRNMTMQRTLKFYKLPESPRVPGFRPFTAADVSEAYRLSNEFLSKFDLSPVFSEEEFRHWFIPRPGIVDSYVVENDGVITDFVSFYTLPSTVMHHPVHKSLKAAYSFYNVCGKTPWTDLMQDALVVAKNMGFDVFNALDLMDNKQFLDKLKFGIGDGNLQYYLYNWRCPDMKPNQVGLVLQ